MCLIKAMAKEIIESLSVVTPHQMFVTDLEGNIIASTEIKREGQRYHPAVDAIFRNNMVVDDSDYFRRDNQLHCCCVVPIEVHHSVVGAVGVIGDSNETLKFMGLVKKYTELLVSDQEVRSNIITKQKKIENLIRLISHQNSDGTEDIHLCSQAMEMGFNLESQYVSMIIELKYMGKKPNQDQINLVQEMIKLEFLHPQNMIAQIKEDTFFLFVKATSAHPENIISRCKIQASRLYETLYKRDWDVYIGIGSMSASLKRLRDIYYEAWVALALAKKFGNDHRIVFIGDYLLEEVLLSVNKKQCEAYLDKTVNKIKMAGEDNILFDTVKVWCESGFRKNETSKRLNIHRNTLDYRLKRLEDISGICVDKYKEMLELYLDILINSV